MFSGCDTCNLTESTRVARLARHDARTHIAADLLDVCRDVRTRALLRFDAAARCICFVNACWHACNAALAAIVVIVGVKHQCHVVVVVVVVNSSNACWLA